MKIIKFIPWPGKEGLMESKPIKASIPQWWKDGETEIEVSPDSTSSGMKTCVPFMEIMMTGYVLVTPFDIYITKDENGDIAIRWQGPEKVYQGFIGERPKELGHTIPRPAGHNPNGFTWSSQWSWKTPRGYSTFVTHPFNRHDLPFTTLNGIIDSDKFHANGNIPFFLKENYEGIIPAGTPFAQIYPFKRDKWKSWIDDSLNDRITNKQALILREEGKSYKKRFWQKKEFR